MIINLPLSQTAASRLINSLLLNSIIALFHTSCYTKQISSMSLQEVFSPLAKWSFVSSLKEGDVGGQYTVHPLNNTASMPVLESNKIYFLLLYIVIIVLLVIFLERVKNKKKHNLEASGEEDEECFIEKILIKSGSKKSNNMIQKDKELMSCDVRDEILKKLHVFEEGTKYTDKNFNLSALSVKLKTNSKYLSYIINNYKKKDFNCYINELRIHYIIRKMESNPAYLHYKISYLADECGFSSHSKFTAVFGAIVGISPSHFMDELSKRHAVERSEAKKP